MPRSPSIRIIRSGSPFCHAMNERRNIWSQAACNLRLPPDDRSRLTLLSLQRTRLSFQKSRTCLCGRASKTQPPWAASGRLANFPLGRSSESEGRSSRTGVRALGPTGQYDVISNCTSNREIRCWTVVSCLGLQTRLRRFEIAFRGNWRDSRLKNLRPSAFICG